MKNQRLYKAEMTGFPAEALYWLREDLIPEWLDGRSEGQETRADGEWYAFEDTTWEPEEWPEYVLANQLIDRRETERQGHTVYMSFCWPSTDRIYKSRSSAQARVDLIEMWGGKAVLLETTTDWTPVEVANRRRAQERLQARISRKQSELWALTEKLDSVPISPELIRVIGLSADRLKAVR